MQERFIVAVDLGDSKIALSVSKVTGGVAQVVHYGEAPSQGIQHGIIFNPRQVCIPLSELIRQAEEELEIHITMIVTAYPGWKISTQEVSHSCTREDPESFITEEEMDTLQDLALTKFANGLDSSLEVYGVVPQSFSTEVLFQKSREDIIGSTAEKLEGTFKLFYGAKRPVTNIDKVSNELQIANCKFFTAEAEAQSLLSKDEKEQGVALVEIGGGVTSVSVFHKGILRFHDSFPFGGKAVTSDIRHECRISDELAENIKLGFGSCMPDRLQTLSDKTLRIQGDGSGDVSIKYLSEIISSRMREIADAALGLIAKSGYADRLRSGIVLTGGGARILSCSALFAEMSGLSVRLQFPRPSYISVEGYPKLDSPEGVASLALIGLARDNASINCATLKEFETPEPKVESEAGPGDLFEKEKEEEVIEPKDKKPKEKQKEKERKKAKPARKGLWTVIDNFAGGIFDENIGNDNSEEDKNNV